MIETGRLDGRREGLRLLTDLTLQTHIAMMGAGVSQPLAHIEERETLTQAPLIGAFAFGALAPAASMDGRRSLPLLLRACSRIGQVLENRAVLRGPGTGAAASDSRQFGLQCT